MLHQYGGTQSQVVSLARTTISDSYSADGENRSLFGPMKNMDNGQRFQWSFFGKCFLLPSDCTISEQASLQFGKNQDKLFYSPTQCQINSNYVRVRSSTPSKYKKFTKEEWVPKTLNVKSLLFLFNIQHLTKVAC